MYYNDIRELLIPSNEFLDTFFWGELDGVRESCGDRFVNQLSSERKDYFPYPHKLYTALMNCGKMGWCMRQSMLMGLSSREEM